MKFLGFNIFVLLSVHLESSHSGFICILYCKPTLSEIELYNSKSWCHNKLRSMKPCTFSIRLLSCVCGASTHPRISKDTWEGLVGENATLKKEATVIWVLATQNQKLVSCWVCDKSLDLGHTEKYQQTGQLKKKQHWLFPWLVIASQKSQYKFYLSSRQLQLITLISSMFWLELWIQPEHDAGGIVWIWGVMRPG